MKNKSYLLLQRAKRKGVVFSFLGAALILSISFIGIAIQDHIIEQQKSVRQLYTIILNQLNNIHRSAILADRFAEILPRKEEQALRKEYNLTVSKLIADNLELRQWLTHSRAERAITPEDTKYFSTIYDKLNNYIVAAEKIAMNKDQSFDELKASVRYLSKNAHTGLADIMQIASRQLETESQRILEDLKVIGVVTVIICVAVAFLIWYFVFRPMIKMLFDQHRNLVQSVIDAESASRSKTEFLANVSHEIRTPMTAILGYSELLKRNQCTADEVDSITGIINENAAHLLRLIDDILDVSKAEAGNIPVVKSEIELRKILGEIHSLLKVKASEKGIAFNVFAQGSVPEVIVSDPVRLKQILFNIVSNAIKFTEEGSVKVTVSIVQQEGRGLLQFLVKDTGGGISDSVLPRLFQPFVQADASNTRRHRGTGLGLVLAKKLAQKLGGDVKVVSSILGVGSIFAVTIDPGPSAHQRLITTLNVEGQAAVSEQSKKMNGIGSQLRGAKILVVDDAAENARLFRIYLEKAQAEVDVAVNGFDAVKLACERDYDLIFLDLQMPEKDGYTVLHEMRGSQVRSPVVALTAHAMAEDVERTRRAGFDDHVSKPVSWEKLVEVAGNYVGESIVS